MKKEIVDNINGYLMSGTDIFIESRNSPLFNVPKIGIGNKLIDNGNYLFKKEEMIEFIKQEPGSKKFFKPWYGTKEIVCRKPRYCLFLGNVKYDSYKNMPKVLELVNNVMEYRKLSSKKNTRELAYKPTTFEKTKLQPVDYWVIPGLVPSDRTYLTLFFLSKEYLTSASMYVIDDCKLYHFGILSSDIHMKWVRIFCGRLGNQIRYSASVVYNNFPWPVLNSEQKREIEEAAQNILNIREKYKNKSYAYLYNPETMPGDLKAAHEQNDKVVKEAYGINEKATDEEIIGKLIYLYIKRVRELDEKRNSK